jgi:hypothetical protein
MNRKDIELDLEIKLLLESELRKLERNFVSLLSKVSYYNAAPSPQWIKETDPRRDCLDSLRKAATFLLENGRTREDLKILAEGQLCSESDYLPPFYLAKFNDPRRQ